MTRLVAASRDNAGRVKSIVAPSPSLQVGQAQHRFAVAVATPFLLLGLGQLLPETGVGAAVRLSAAAAIVLLVPGALVQRALGWPVEIGVALAGALAWSLVLLFAALAVTFVVNGSLTLTLLLLAAGAAAAAVVAAGRGGPATERTDALAALGVVVASLPLAAAAWLAYRTAAGDALFHVAYARKLEELGSLESLESIGQFAQGGLHPGYAFPLWHGALAAIARLSGVDVAATVVHLGPLLTPLASVLAYGAGAVLFRSWAGGVASASAFIGLAALTGERLGLAEVLSDPEAASRGLLVPALLALAFRYVRGRSWAGLASVGAASFVLTVIHPNYAPYTAALLAGCLAARLVVLRRVEEKGIALAVALGAIALTAVAFVAWLWPTVSDTAAVTASTADTARDIAHYSGFFEGDAESFRVDPDAIARRGGLVVVALLAIPLAAFAGRRLWSSLVLGGSLLILAVLLLPPVFTLFADLVSVSQSRRLVAFLPLPFALAGAAVVAGRFRVVGVAAALGVGIAASVAFPAGESRAGAWPVWIAFAGAGAALAYAAWKRQEGPEPGPWAAAAAAALVLPFGVASAVGLEREPLDPFALSPGLTAALRASTDADDVVLSRPETTYRVSAQAPVYIVAAPISHATDTQTSRARERLADTALFFDPETSAGARLAVLDKYGVSWLVLDKRRGVPQGLAGLVGDFERVYEDGRYVLLRTGRS